MRVLITGATGIVGLEIVKQLNAKGIGVNFLTTNKTKISSTDNYKGFYWNPATGEIDTNCLNGVSAAINLAGASIAKRWTKAHKKRVIDSRIQSTQLLYNTLKNNTHNITRIISASAIGCYPSSLTNHYTEDETVLSTSFLGEVVKEWETATDQFKDLNLLVSKVRIGIVFDTLGGAFPKMVSPIKNYVGAAMGNGKQWLSWIDSKDLAGIFLHIIEHHLEGVYNAVAPTPLTNKSLTVAVAKHLKRPLWLPNIPKFVMQLALGDMHALLFESQRVSSKKIEDTGFTFKYKTVTPALEHLIFT